MSPGTAKSRDSICCLPSIEIRHSFGFRSTIRADFFPAKIDEKVFKHALGVIATWSGFDDVRDPGGVQTGEQNGALDLRAGDRRLVGDCVKRGAMDHEGRSIVCSQRGDLCTHLRERLDNSAHRPLGKRGVANQA